MKGWSLSSLLESSDGASPLRVNQLDGIRLNNEIVSLYLSLTQSSLSSLSRITAKLPDSEVLTLLVRLYLWYIYTYRNRPLPGDALLNIRYWKRYKGQDSNCIHGGSDGLGFQNLVRKDKIMCMLAIVVSYILNVLRTGINRRYASENQIIEHISRRRNNSNNLSNSYTTLYRASFTLYRIYSFWSLTVLCLFLINGRYRSVSDFALGLTMREVDPSAERQVSFDLLNRHLYWNNLIQLLLVLLPLVDIRNIGQQLKTIYFRNIKYIFFYIYILKYYSRYVKWRLSVYWTKLLQKSKLKNNYPFIYGLLHKITTILSSRGIYFRRTSSSDHQRRPSSSSSSSVLATSSVDMEPPLPMSKFTVYEDVDYSRDECVFCGIEDIPIRFVSECGHPFCYWCVSQPSSSSLCPRCSRPITNITWYTLPERDIQAAIL